MLDDKRSIPDATASSTDIIPPRVEYKNRVFTDKWWASLYLVSYLSFIICGTFLASNAKSKYVTNEFGNRNISNHYIEDAKKCCDESGGSGSVCYHLEGYGRSNGRNLEGASRKLDGDEGIFDAFIEAPEIIVTLFLLTLVVSVLWIVLLRFFSKSIVAIAEVSKVGICLFVAIYLNLYLFYGAAAISLLYTIWARKKLAFAAKILSHSALALKENPSILTGALVVKLFYALNAALFVFFFTESFNVVEVQNIGSSISDDGSGDFNYCEFVSPSYTYNLVTYLSASFLWTILFLDSVRLSITATIVGSWHFHPEDEPGFLIAMKNVGSSLGTISLCSLIAAFAEWVRRWLLCDSLWDITIMSCCLFPLQIFICMCSSAIRVFVSTFTKFSLILHVFGGTTFVGSSKSAFKILSRHFKGGFVTEVTSRSVMHLSSYAFSLSFAMVAWAWISDRFDCKSIPDLDTWLFFLYFLILMFNLYYPVLGLYIMILVNTYLRRAGRLLMEQQQNDDTFTGDDYSINHYWIPPLAACFVGCLAMMMFSFLSAIFLDIVDTLFLCFAIDKDNNVDVSSDVFCLLIKEMPDYIDAEAIVLDPENGSPNPSHPLVATAIAVNAKVVPEVFPSEV